VSLDSQFPPAAAPQEQPPVPAPQPGTSGLAIAGLIFAFVIAPIGFLLSLIAVFKTGKGKQKGRGLAIAGLIVSVLVIGGGVAIVAAVANSTVADPGCVDGKKAILDGASNVDAGSLQKTVDGLTAAAAKAKHDDVRAAMTALADDYKQLLTAMTTGNVPPGIEAKVEADANKIDDLCSIGA
jgi:hypothetical protein